MSDHDSFSNGRRRFLSAGLVGLSGVGYGGSTLGYLVKMMTDGMIARAQAAEVTGLAGTRNYVNLLLPGAPNRYVFDHWLRTDAQEPAIVANSMNGNALASSGGRVFDTKHDTFMYGGLLVPSFFSHSVKMGSGQVRPLTDLLKNMLVIRGYGTGFDGHSPNVASQLGPLGGASSITGVAADSSTRSFQALQFPSRGAFGNYSSTTGKALNIVGSNKPLNQLMAGFKVAPGNTGSLLKRQQAALDMATERLQSYIKLGFAGSTTLAKNMANAKVLMKKGISDVDDYWAEAMARYTSAYTNSARMTGLAGVSDVSLMPNTANPKFRVHVSEGDRSIMPKGDLASIIRQAQPPSNLIEGFALAEYVLTQGLGTSLELMIPTDDVNRVILSDGNVEEVTGSDGSKTNFAYHNDMHGMGAIACVVTTSVLFRGISATLLELIDRLKATQMNGSDLWSQTVFQITSDFGRIGRSDGLGGDHGINQMVTSVYSGVIQKPMVVGNIYSNGHNPGFDTVNAYSGTQGAGAPIENYNQTGLPTPAMMASTVTALLGVPSNPFANVASPLVDVTGGAAVARVNGKLVAG